MAQVDKEYFSRKRAEVNKIEDNIIKEGNPSKKPNITNSDDWDIDKLLYKEPRRITPVIDPVKGRFTQSRLYFSEQSQSFDMPNIEQRPNENPRYEFICQSSDYVLNAFCNVIQAKIWNGFHFTTEQIIAEWNYFAFTLRILRSDVDAFKRLGKPCKEESAIVEKYVNFYDGDYKENDMMKAEHLVSIQDDSNKTIKCLHTQILQLELKNEELKKKNSEYSITITRLMEQLNAQIENDSNSEEDDKLETSFTATPLQTILLFRELGVDFTNGTIYNKTKVKQMLNILTSKSEGNINKKLSSIDEHNKYVQKDMSIIKKLLNDIKN